MEKSGESNLKRIEAQINLIQKVLPETQRKMSVSQGY